MQSMMKERSPLFITFIPRHRMPTQMKHKVTRRGGGELFLVAFTYRNGSAEYNVVAADGGPPIDKNSQYHRKRRRKRSIVDDNT